jgi:Pvc16 N-terminal domain
VIHEVDELLEKLVKKDALNGGSSVELVFDAPTKDWVARRNGPAVDLYLYDIREDLQRRVPVWEDQRGPDGLVNARSLPPRRFKLSYLVTAWTQRPEDEHRLLSSLLSAFIRNPMIKPELLEGSLAEPNLPVYIDVGQPPSQDRSLADVWSALGGELKPSLDVVVIAPIMVTRVAPYGPPVRTSASIGLAAQGEPELFSGGSGNGKGGKRGKAGATAVATLSDTEADEGSVGGKVLELIPPVADPGTPVPGMSLRVRGFRRR